MARLLFIVLATAASGCSLITPTVEFAGIDAGVDAGTDAGPCRMACPTERPFCEATSGECRQCLLDSDCTDLEPCTVERCAFDGTCTSSPDPSCITHVEAGPYHTCGVRGSGEVYCWGVDMNGALGNGAGGDSNIAAPVSIEFATGVIVGEAFACARRDSNIMCWGFGRNGRLGDGGTTDSQVPVAVMNVPGYGTQISAGLAHVCARPSTGNILCWGWNGLGQLGDANGGFDSSIPVAVVGIDDATDISAGSSHTCAVRAGGTAMCWGPNYTGALGDGTIRSSDTPTSVVGLVDIVQISAGGRHTCARLADGSIACWGYNGSGALGDGTMGVDRPMPTTRVSGIDDAVLVSAGADYTCAVRSTGAVLCWGDNEMGQLGDGTTASSPLPVVVPGLTAAEVSAGDSVKRTCARSTTGEVFCWGASMIGDGTMADRPTPTLIMGL